MLQKQHASSSTLESTRRTMTGPRCSPRLLVVVLLLSECSLRVSAHYFSPVVVKVKDVTIRADREGISGEWEERSWNEEYHVIISSPTTSQRPTEEPLKPLSTTGGANGFHIPSSELARYNFIELNIAIYRKDGELFNVSLYLEQQADTRVVVKVKDVTIRADREGISGEWEERSWNEEYHVIISSPTTAQRPTEEPLKPLSTTGGANGFHIPSSELARYNFIELNIAIYGKDGELFNVSLYLEQQADTRGNKSVIHLTITPLLLMVIALFTCLGMVLLVVCGGGGSGGGSGEEEGGGGVGERLRRVWEQRRGRWRGEKTGSSRFGGDGRYVKLIVGLKHDQLVQQV